MKLVHGKNGEFWNAEKVLHAFESHDNTATQLDDYHSGNHPVKGDCNLGILPRVHDLRILRCVLKEFSIDCDLNFIADHRDVFDNIKV